MHEAYSTGRRRMTKVDWALTREGLSPPKQLLLVALAWIADEDGVTFKSQATLAARVGRDPRWIREHLPALAEAGLVSRVRRHRPNGSRTTDLLVLNVPRATPLDLSIYDGIVGELEPGDRPPTGGIPPGGLPAESRQATGGFSPPRSSPLDSTSQKKECSARASKPDPCRWPDGHRPTHAEEQTAEVLAAVAAEHQSKAVSLPALAAAVAAEPEVDHVREAHRLRSWAADRDIRDVVATYRNWIKRADRVARPTNGHRTLPAARGPNGRQAADLEVLAAIARGER